MLFFLLYPPKNAVFLSDWIEGGEYSGQWDALFRVGSDLLVLDWKFGRVAVDSAEANRQLEALVPLAAQKANEEGIIYNGIYAAIIQPRVAGPASVTFYDDEAISQAEQDSLAVARAAMDPDAPALLQRGRLPVLPGQGGVPRSCVHGGTGFPDCYGPG